jgi:hypothetical protein
MRHLAEYNRLNLSSNDVVSINYDDEHNSRFVKKLRPVVFRKGLEYCCLLGPSLEKGIVGRGITADKAINEWEKQIIRRLENFEEDDKIVFTARKILISNRPPANYI